MFRVFLMSFRNNAYNFHLTPLTLTPLTPLQSSNVVNRLYSNSLTTDKAEDERSYKGVIAKN